MATEPVAAATLWSWYKSNYAALLKRLSRDRMGRAIGTLREACDEPARNDVDAFFAPKTTYLTGATRVLALVEQRITRCAAFRQQKSMEVATALREISK
jgi:hypothetical protein